jgi:hypothetical protein
MMKIPHGSKVPQLLFDVLEQWERGQSFIFFAQPGNTPEQPWNFVAEQTELQLNPTQRTSHPMS